MLEKVFQSINLKLKRKLRLVFIIFTILLSISLIRNIIKISQAGKRIDEVQSRVERLKEENNELEDRLEDVRSDAYIEKELREKLGLAKEGETILVLPEEDILKNLVPKREEDTEILPEPNWKRWLKLFF